MPESLDLAEIRRLYSEGGDNLETCQRLAQMPHLPFKVMEGMANSDNIEIVVAIASHPDLHGSLMQKLSRHDNVRVRCAIAMNKGLGSATFMALCHDESPLVRLHLVRNPKLPLRAQITLSDDEIPFVRAELLNRKALDEEIQLALCSDVDLTVHVKALLYPKLSSGLIRQWAKTGTKLSLLALAQRKNLPDDVIDILLERGGQQVRDILATHLK